MNLLDSIPDLVEGVGCVRDEFPEEDLLVPVEGVDDELHHAADLGLEGVLLRLVAQLLHLRHRHPVQLDRLLLAAHHLGVSSEEGMFV